MDNTETVQVVTEKDGSKYEGEQEELRAIQSQKLLVIVTRCLRNSFTLY